MQRHTIQHGKRWDIFCRVVDNFGDIGVCWRLAADLGSRGQQVRLWVDDASALAWMAPGGAAGVSVHAWGDSISDTSPGDVVIEAFGCELPAAFVQGMACADRPPRWINLEYLSAEAYVERSHRLPSPQLSGPGQGLTKWFFFPGFTPATGGLLREPGLMDARHRFDRAPWLRHHGIAPMRHERLVSLFSYPNAALGPLLQSLSSTPTLVLLTAGMAMPAALPAQVRCQSLPFLTQTDYDRLLWSCDLNFVRGEDSFVRAQWAGQPFVWQIYPQHDGAHAAKLQAFLDRFPAVPGLRELWLGWNGLGPWPARLVPSWQAQCIEWREQLLQQADLTTQLLGFAGEAG
ncbi:MAG: elongation factor P maturation arginine rhamnosyltransferase EarP [Rhizobacter sp.]|nr:elongation factor P maturation arginine rhamnosyltransferase EarP [Rhizobacter sp.]